MDVFQRRIRRPAQLAFATLPVVVVLVAIAMAANPAAASAALGSGDGAPPSALAAPAEEQPRDLGEVSNAAGDPLEVSADCEESVRIAANNGLRLPDGWQIHCTGPGLDWEGNSHWGVTCPYDECPEGAGPYVSISNPTYYVVAHELCHANFGTDELMADACAAEHGASLETSPYQ
jgi:hypothetical protein